MEDYCKFHDWRVRRGECTKFANFKVKCAPKMEFSEGRRGSKQNPSISIKGGSVHIFWNTSIKDTSYDVNTLHCTCVEHEKE